MGLTVVISGYYGFDNLGDEAILYSIIKMLKSKRDDIDIIVLSQDPETTAQRYGVKAVDRNDFIQIIKVLKKSNLFLSGGGSLLQDVTGLKSVPYYLGLVYLARLLGNKTVFYAQGVGPLNKKMSRYLVRWIGNKTDLITVRDGDSAELLREVGVKPELIKKTVDPVYGLSLFSKSQNKLSGPVREFLTKENIDVQNERLIGVSVRPWGNNSYLDAVAEGADYLAEKTDGRIIILPMYLNDDFTVCKKLKEKIKSPVSLFQDQLKPSEMTSFFREFTFFLGVRLHSLIFAAVNNVPFIGISYDPKVDSLLADLELETYLSTENCKFTDLKNIIDDFWEEREKIAKKLKQKMNVHSCKAEENAVRVLKLLE